ncbi:MAG TPA: SDR family NAD(P)-dependent oxidoreductase [Actinomycetota bacterium]|jgi:NADP-dependent 3-hydroxy acid dehydrogenase YdfG|nr:SDR family NAD(P)-dependent oxidoreductase [Actinomycetota bacterium]
MQLRGAVAVVTGASAGIGEATALALAREGAKVVLAARRLDRLEALAARIEGDGGRAIAVHCDVTDTNQIGSLPAVVHEALGGCDVLINNAGVPGGGAFQELSYEQIENVVRVNALGVMYGTRAFLPGMLKRGRGHVVNVASIAGRYAAPGAAVYTATKHAVIAFSESLYYDARPRGVLVTAINPGFVSTEGFPQWHLPQRLVMKPERVADAIVKIVREGIAPEYSLPRWIGPLQAFRVLTPPLYRWGVRKIREVGLKATQAK